MSEADVVLDAFALKIHCLEMSIEKLIESVGKLLFSGFGCSFQKEFFFFQDLFRKKWLKPYHHEP